MEIQEARTIACERLRLHGLTDLGWEFGFNRNKRRLGVCKQTEKRIELSEHYVIRNTSEHVLDTVLHEIAHALVGTHHGHDDVWKEMCLQIGATPSSCSSTAKMPEGYWQARCPGCMTTFTRHRRPRRLRGRYCVACGPHSGQLTFRDMRVIKQPRFLASRFEKDASAKQLVLKLFG